MVSHEESFRQRHEAMVSRMDMLIDLLNPHQDIWATSIDHIIRLESVFVSLFAILIDDICNGYPFGPKESIWNISCNIWNLFGNVTPKIVIMWASIVKLNFHIVIINLIINKVSFSFISILFKDDLYKKIDFFFLNINP